MEVNHWNQRPEDLRELALMAEHPRTRERLLAIYEICEGKSATEVGKQTGRNPQTVMEKSRNTTTKMDIKTFS